jgi:hypothetical protein
MDCLVAEEVNNPLEAILRAFTRLNGKVDIRSEKDFVQTVHLIL